MKFIARLIIITYFSQKFAIVKRIEGGNYESIAIFTYRWRTHAVLEEAKEYILLRVRSKLLN